MRSITTRWNSPSARLAVLAGCYLAILSALFALATLDAFTTPDFIYQGF